MPSSHFLDQMAVARQLRNGIPRQEEDEAGASSDGGSHKKEKITTEAAADSITKGRTWKLARMFSKGIGSSSSTPRNANASSKSESFVQSTSQLHNMSNVSKSYACGHTPTASPSASCAMQSDVVSGRSNEFGDGQNDRYDAHTAASSSRQVEDANCSSSVREESKLESQGDHTKFDHGVVVESNANSNFLSNDDLPDILQEALEPSDALPDVLLEALEPLEISAGTSSPHQKLPKVDNNDAVPAQKECQRTPTAGGVRDKIAMFQNNQSRDREVSKRPLPKKLAMRSILQPNATSVSCPAPGYVGSTSVASASSCAPGPLQTVSSNRKSGSDRASAERDFRTPPSKNVDDVGDLGSDLRKLHLKSSPEHFYDPRASVSGQKLFELSTSHLLSPQREVPREVRSMPRPTRRSFEKIKFDGAERHRYDADGADEESKNICRKQKANRRSASLSKIEFASNLGADELCNNMWWSQPAPSCVILDVGAFDVKTGYGNIFPCFKPEFVHRTCIGTEKMNVIRPLSSAGQGSQGEAFACGDAAISRSTLLNISYPKLSGAGELIENNDFDALINILDSVLFTSEDGLALVEGTCQYPHGAYMNAPTDNPLPFVLIENAGDDVYLRQRMVQTLFERFSAPAVVVLNSAVLAMRAYDEFGDRCAGSGVVVDVGHAGTRVCIVEDYKISSVATTDIGGNCVDDFLFRFLHDDGRILTSTSERELCRRIKHEVCHCAKDFASCRNAPGISEDSHYSTPDGRYIEVGILRTLAPEVFFNPQLPENGGDTSQSLQAVIASLLNDVDASRREYLCQHIILCGGSSALTGLTTRLQHELQAVLTDESCENLRVIAPKNMSHVAWRGAAQLVMSAEKLQYVTRNEYAQKGPSVCNELADSAYW